MIQQPPPDPVEAKEEEEEEEEEEVAQEGDNGAAEGAKKKKKKKKSKKKKTGAAPTVQSDPPRVGLSFIFPNGVYPEGEIQEYKNDNSYRTTSAEKKEAERLACENPETTYQNIRRAAEVHRQVRAHARKHIRPGQTMTDIANNIEEGVRALVEAQGREKGGMEAENWRLSGIGFPTGLSLNECAAHYTPNAGDTRVLQQKDILKVDIGVQVNGRICDSAFTLSFEPTYDALMNAVKDATNTGVREAGIDVRLGDIGAAIQEVMESYEVVVGTNTYQVKSIENLSGHSIDRYRIHGGKSVPIVKTADQTKMEEGELFAIETFGSTGRGRVIESGDCSHYAKMRNPRGTLRLESAKSLLRSIDKHFGTLPFCRRYLDRYGESKYLLALKSLVQEGIVQDYPPLCDVKGAMTAQFEHTILLRPTVKEVVSRGEDY
ncbi:methionine aminopeptidase [Rhizoctonia solani AG-3 Rhs1AP]|uniref:Methionine aminopeptidase 2 n=1 Tax=Rhizoctonia solani AG-3 Rhs1AP TaxID=1086054 RepID=X8J4Z9_9AGAM|nr:methionine aminopeptidase [Rhizoctonia solani AG-3 Rhs1AP]